MYVCVVGYSISISHYIPVLSQPTPNETPLNLHYYSKKLWSKWVWVPGYPQTRQRRMWEEPSYYVYRQKERFGLQESVFWPGQMMPGLFLKEIATKAGIQHPAQKLLF